MRHSKALFTAALAAVVGATPLLADAPTVAVGVQQNVTVNVNLGQNGPPMRINGMVDYGNNLVYIKSEGLPKEGVTSKAQKRWTAREAAYLYAMRDLALMVVGMTIGGRMSAKEGQLVESIVAGAFKAKVKAGAQYDDPDHPKMKALGLAKGLGWNRDDEVYTIVMEARLTGAESVADAWCSDQVQQALQKIEQMRPQQAAAPTGLHEAEPTAAVQYQNVEPTKAAPAAGAKTGVIVLCDTLGVQAGLAPKIFRGEDGDAFFGTNVPTKVAVETGAVGYASSEAEARKNPRVGSDPIVVTAIKKRGNYGAAISEADADMLVQENGTGKFLDSFSVVFVVKDDVQ